MMMTATTLSYFDILSSTFTRILLLKARVDLFVAMFHVIWLPLSLTKGRQRRRVRLSKHEGRNYSV